MTALVWYRRDLRLHEHPALRAALDRHDRVVTVFCLDDRLLLGRHRSGSRTRFLLEALADLDAELHRRGGGLVVRHGPPERELPRLAAELGAAEIHLTRDDGPFDRRRLARLRSALDRSMTLHLHAGLGVIDDLAAPQTGSGDPYSVFSPFHRDWLQRSRREVLAAPAELPTLPRRVAKGRIPSLAALGLSEQVASPPPGGETPGREILERFLRCGAESYDSERDLPAADGTSRLSPYLHFGCISPRELEARLGPRPGPAELRRQLCWRDFHHHVLIHHPRNAHSEFQSRYRGTIRWSRSKTLFDAWRAGRTGYPFVDAAMRQLRQEGWMHNRARLVAACFLTKDLGIDWRWGERHFMRLLVDGDEANNNGNWQWIASVGTDPQPLFRRLYNPTRQLQRHDPEGTYVRRFVGELAQVPAAYLAEPWTMPDEVQEAAGCLIGRDYPAPVVDHAVARRAALERYRAA